MEILNGSETIEGGLRGGVIALGNFDGFHRGHQAVVGRALALARERGVPALVGTFDPHPARYFRGGAEPFQLTSIAQRARLFAGFGMDAMAVFHFQDGLADATPETYVTDWLAGRLGVTGVVTGRDFTFGRNRSGNIGDLAQIGARHGMTDETVSPVTDADGVISSTRIRAALRAGDMAAATALMARSYAIEGVVAHGDKLGRTIGFPTANVTLGDYLRPAYGVYAVRCRLADGRLVDGVANIGIRPMFDPPKELLEVHLFDFAGDLYDQTVEVELHHYLRPEMRLDGLDALVAQIGLDCVRAKELLAA